MLVQLTTRQNSAKFTYFVVKFNNFFFSSAFVPHENMVHLTTVIDTGQYHYINF